MTETGGDMRMLVEQIAQALVDAPEQVQVTPVEDGDATILELRVAATDLGKVIGRQGRTAKSIRTLLGAASMKYKKRYILEIIEDEEDDERGNWPGGIVDLSALDCGPAARMTEEAEFVTIARVAKTQGRHGEVAATLLTDFPELFETRKKLFALGDSSEAKRCG